MTTFRETANLQTGNVQSQLRTQQPIPPSPLEEQWAYIKSVVTAMDRKAAEKAQEDTDEMLADLFLNSQEAQEESSPYTLNPDLPARFMGYLAKPNTDAEAKDQQARMQFAKPMAYLMPEEAAVLMPRTSWEYQRTHYPLDYKEDWTNFQELRARAMAGDFGPELQLQAIGVGQ